MAKRAKPITRQDKALLSKIKLNPGMKLAVSDAASAERLAAHGLIKIEFDRTAKPILIAS